MRDEFYDYIGAPIGHDCSVLPDIGTQITEGAFEEDCDFHMTRHFWDPDTNDGLWGFDTALTRATELYELAVAFYEANETAAAYYELGRVAHLLEDMAQPAHVHLDEHLPIENDNFEGICEDHPTRWSATEPPGDEAEVNAYVGYDANGNLKPLDYRTLPANVGTAFTASTWLERLFLNLAETADAFESEDEWAETDAIQLGHSRSTINWHSTTSPPSGLTEFTEEEALLHADTLVPLAIRYVAALYQLFWDETHPPDVSTGAASAIGKTTATVSASVNPNGTATTLYFDYGKTSSYGSTATYGSIGLGTSSSTRTYTLSNLSCGAIYHYRARAANGVVEDTGDDRTFTTDACTPACYSLSMVANPMVGGTVGPTTSQNCSGGYTNGTSVGITAAASSGHQFSGWTATNCTLANASSLSTTCAITGANAVVSGQFTSTSPSESELLTNGSFASGSTRWTRSGNFFADSRFSVCRSCPGYAYLANTDGSAGNNLSGLLYQAVTIPPNATSATLSFWYRITTQETTSSTAHDVLFVSIQDKTTGSAKGIAELSNLNANGSYVKRTASLAGYAGHTIWVAFSASTNGTNPTVFRVDDVSLEVTTASCTSFTISPTARNPSASAGSRTVTITGSPSGCQGGAWTASANESWLDVWPTSGAGSGSTVVSWDENPSASSRSAKAMIAGNVFSVTQAGQSSSSCTSFTLDPTSWSPTALAGSASVTLIGAPNGCENGNWSAAGNGSWLTVSPTSGTGPSTVTVSWSENPNGSARGDHATIANNSFTVVQGGAAGAPIESYTFTHLAGGEIGAGYFDGTHGDARFSYPEGIAIDTAGSIYVADSRNHTVRKITGAGVATLAGLAGSRGSADGHQSEAQFSWPSGVALDGGGNLYVADSSNHVIRRITPTGAVTTLAGLAGNPGSVDGMGSAARFLAPKGVAVDSSGNVYVAEAGNHTIRKITSAGVVTTFAGLASSSGSTDGTGSAARFNAPNGVATDLAGNVYVADRENQTIRKITPAGVVTTLAGLAGNGGSDNGTGSAARFWFPSGVATDSAGNVYVVDNMHAIRKISPAGVVTTLAGQAAQTGSADGTGNAARFRYPRGIATDAAGNVYVADTLNNTIRNVTTGGVVTTVAGLAPHESGTADATGSAARFDGPFGITTDNAGNVYVADSGNYAIRKISPDGVVSTLAGLPGTPGDADGTGRAARFSYSHDVALDGGANAYVTDSGNHTIRKITPAGVVTTFAGFEDSPGSTDGTGSEARFRSPYGVATESAGNIYVADSFNHTIRKITSSGAVTTFAGLAGSAGSTDGTGNAARFNHPLGIATDSAGNVYVADTLNATIRKITPSGVVTTLAGLAGSNGSADGPGSTARFYLPSGVEIDSSGNIYVADARNNAIRKITPAGVVSTLAGATGTWGSTDGMGSAVRFNEPSGVALDSSGNLYVGDRHNNAIRVGRRAISDTARIDSATGTVGAVRQLDVAPQNATSWQWRVIRRPAGSMAELSSTTLSNPTFTPDVPDLYQFQLVATSSAGMSITVVSLKVSPAAPPTAPMGVNAVAMTNTRVDVAWNAVAGATYQIDRRQAGAGFSQIGVATTNSYSDTSALANQAYLYCVRAVSATGVSPSSTVALATTVIFDDRPLTTGLPIRAIHVSQLRTAVGAVRALAGVPAVAFTEPVIAGTRIKAVHVTELRSALDAALTALGLSTGGYTETSLAGALVKAVHLQELRDRIQ